MGTGNAFSLLPAQNASGNWIKVVQRVPVKVVLDEGELSEHPLRIGLSMNATIETAEGKSNDMPEFSTQASMTPAYISDALIIDTAPVDTLIANIIQSNGQP